MLNVVFYQTNQDLLKKLHEESSPLVICPSPIVADNLRNLAPRLEILTISKWVSDHLKNLGLARSRKSELMVKLAAVWRHYFPDQSVQLFQESFELFTELRSYTLSMDLLGEFLLELDEVISKSIRIFWLYLEQEKIIDEHLSYSLVTKEKKKLVLWFVGFKHMSGVQIDMIKILAESCEVKVFFPDFVFTECLPNDWINWLIDSQNTEKKQLEEIRNKVKVSLIPKGKTNIVLSYFYKKHKDCDVILAGSNMELVGVQEVQAPNSFFKTTEDLFSTDIGLLTQELRDFLRVKKVLTNEEMNVFLIDLKKKSIEKGEYRKLKIAELMEIALESYSEFQKNIEMFTIDIIEIIAKLNAPRVSLLSLESKKERSFLDMNSLNFRDENKAVVLLATESMGGFRASEKILSEKMTKALRVIGPIKRAGLDFLFHKFELLSILSDQKNVLLIEEQLLESDLSWREILKHFEVTAFDLEVSYSVKKVKEYLKDKMKTGPFLAKYFSASRLQSFIDCPQKYYFNYIEKIDHRPEERSSLGADELGNLEHKIIAAYFEDKRFIKGDDLNGDVHREACVRIFNEYVDLSRLTLSETERARSFNEIMHYSWNGITFLLELIRDKNFKNIKFEIPLKENPWQLKGSIDCLIELENKKMILIDFKRSATACGTKAETLELKKIQLWAYMLVLHHHGTVIESFGYLNLSDINDDKLFFNEEETLDLINSTIENAKVVIEDAIAKIQSTTVFAANPREDKVCTYCPVNLFCLKSESYG